jgi:uncharacterized protein
VRIRVERSNQQISSVGRHGHLPALSLALCLVVAASAHAEKLDQLKPTGYVDDFAGVIDSTTRSELDELCAEVDQKTHAQIAVVTIHTLEDVPIEDFANKLYERWGIGPKSDNRGVLILLAVNDHRYRVEVGYGLEPILPDGKVGGFGREVVPHLRQRDYSGALLRLTQDVAQVIAADRGVNLTALKGAEPAPAPQGSGPSSNLILLLMVAGMMFFGGFGVFLPLLFGRRRGSGRRWWMGPGPWIGGGWGGGTWGSGGGFGGGGGGFGGFGGGMSGGGGASGSW